MNPYSRAKDFPPVLVRLLARTRYGKPLTTDEIAKSSGLSPVYVEAISQKVDWREIDVVTMEAFCKGCRFDFTNTKDFRRVESYLRARNPNPSKVQGPTLHYLMKSPHWKTFYLPLLRRWGKHAQTKWTPLQKLLTRLGPMLK